MHVSRAATRLWTTGLADFPGHHHDISSLPEVEGEKTSKKKFEVYPIGFFHVDIAEVRTEEGEIYLFIAIDRTSKFAFAELYEKAGKMNAAKFQRHLIEVVPYAVHTILTDNGIQFADRKTDQLSLEHIFGRVCREDGIENRPTRVNHPWTNGHLQTFLAAYNYTKRLKTLRVLTPYEYICKF